MEGKTQRNGQTEKSQQQAGRRRKRKKGRFPLFLILILALLPGWSALTLSVYTSGSTASTVEEVSVQPTSTADVQETPEQEMPQADDWQLILVNAWNQMPKDYVLRLTKLSNGHAVDERCYPDLQEMMDDCRAAGLRPLICSSYRSAEKQEQLFSGLVHSLVAQGFSKEDAEEAASKEIARPGTSEHQLGLAVDIVDEAQQMLDVTQEETAVQQWLMQNSWRYGFILRYPREKSELTGVMYEPWHYRYVGRDVAEYITAHEICLEEYWSQLS